MRGDQLLHGWGQVRRDVEDVVGANQQSAQVGQELSCAVVFEGEGLADTGVAKFGVAVDRPVKSFERFTQRPRISLQGEDESPGVSGRREGQMASAAGWRRLPNVKHRPPGGRENVQGRRAEDGGVCSKQMHFQLIESLVAGMLRPANEVCEVAGPFLKANVAAAGVEDGLPVRA